MNYPHDSEFIDAIRSEDFDFDEVSDSQPVIDAIEKINKEFAEAVEDEHGVLYSRDGKRLLQGRGGLRSYTIKSGTLAICDLAFLNCTSLRRIKIPETVTAIGFSVFCGCTSLKHIELPDAVTYIGDSAFSGCEALASIHIPDTVASIGDSAFKGCRSFNIKTRL